MTAQRMVGLFAGIAGLEVGMARHGWATEMLCEVDAGAQAVLAHHFPGVPLVGDIASLTSLPSDTDLVTAGFPCQDLSQAGRTVGIGGSRSGLVEHVFRLLGQPSASPRWLLLENVPFMLKLDRGQAMHYVTSELEQLGFRWAYRVVDARAFGLPQRRQRVLLLASRTDDPREVLFGQDAGPPSVDDHLRRACGFYWTEGVRGLGWAVDAVPTLKGGSTVGIASPPAIRLAADRQIVTPGITDVERLQGLDPDWTRPAWSVPGARKGHRWKLVGNAVSTRMSEWVGARLASIDAPYFPSADDLLEPGSPWPAAAWGSGGKSHRVDVSQWPIRAPYTSLEGFLDDPRPLSARATAGFLRRTEQGSLRFPARFLEDVAEHLSAMGGDPRAVA